MDSKNKHVYDLFYYIFINNKTSTYLHNELLCLECFDVIKLHEETFAIYRNKRDVKYIRLVIQ